MVYRDVWERKPFTVNEIFFCERRPWGEPDYPETRDMLNAMNAMAYGEAAGTGTNA